MFTPLKKLVAKNSNKKYLDLKPQLAGDNQLVTEEFELVTIENKSSSKWSE